MSRCELPDFFSTERPKARKEYRCCECKAPILKGERHGKFTGKWDGEIDSFRQHDLCEEACVYIKKQFQGGECIAFGELKDWVNDCNIAAFKRDEKGRKFRAIVARIKLREHRAMKSLTKSN